MNSTMELLLSEAQLAGPLIEQTQFVLVSIFIALTSCFLLSASWNAQRRRVAAAAVGKPLPGPPRLPVLGSYPFISLPYRRWLAEGTRQYGEIFGFQLAGQYWISLNSFDAIHALEEFHEELSGRPQGLWSKNLFNGNGVALGEGLAWKKHRKFVHRFVRSCQQTELEPMVEEALHCRISKLGGESKLVPSELFTEVTTNIVFRIIFGHRASENQEFTDRLKAVQTIVQKDIYSTFSTAVLLPYLLAFPNLLFYLVKKTRNAQLSIRMLLSFIEDQMLRNSQQYDDSCELNSFVEAAIGDQELADLKSRGEGSLAVTIFDMFIGATDSTSSCLKWIFLYLATYEGGAFQEEVARELSELPESFSDAQPDEKSHRLLALVTEVLRFHPPLPTAINHRAKKDISVMGYRIPAGAWVFPNLREAHRNTQIFGDSPDKFNPYRFLTGPDGKFQESKHVIPFSVGPRFCPGKRLALTLMQLVVAKLVRRFRFRLADDATTSAELSSLMSDSEGLVWSPKGYRLLMVPRRA